MRKTASVLTIALLAASLLVTGCKKKPAAGSAAGSSAGSSIAAKMTPPTGPAAIPWAVKRWSLTLGLSKPAKAVLTKAGDAAVPGLLAAYKRAAAKYCLFTQRYEGHRPRRGSTTGASMMMAFTLKTARLIRSLGPEGKAAKGLFASGTELRQSCKKKHPPDQAAIDKAVKDWASTKGRSDSAKTALKKAGDAAVPAMLAEYKRAAAKYCELSKQYKGHKTKRSVLKAQATMMFYTAKTGELIRTLGPEGKAAKGIFGGGAELMLSCKK